MNRSLPQEIMEQVEIIDGYARAESLDFFPTIFEILTPDQMAQFAAYGGFPRRYPHWRFGMEYERLRKQSRYGLGRIYEMVVNNDPCYAYLLYDNMPVDQKTVIAHVYAHCDFFKNNIWFSRTNRKMIDDMANHATKIRRYIERHGLDRVEQLIETFLSLDNLIDPHSVFMRREPSHHHREDDEKTNVTTVTRFPAKSYMDRYINPPEILERDRESQKAEQERTKDRFPVKPVRDVLLFLLQNAPMEDWEADILSIIREEAYYFAPQGQTKILNEGWASYWHSTIMTNNVLRDDEVIDYCEHHSDTLATSPGRLNPYKIGIELLRDVERRWNTGRYGLEYDACDDMAARREWGKEKAPRGRVVGKESAGREKIFQVRTLYNDVTFLDEFLTPEFVDEQKLYHYRYDPSTGRMVIVSRDFDKIKKELLFMLTNHGQPYIYILDGNYRNRGELYLSHQHNGPDIEMKHAVETLQNIQTVWKRPVHLHAYIDDEPILFTCDGEKSSQQHVDENIELPANQL